MVLVVPTDAEAGLPEETDEANVTDLLFKIEEGPRLGRTGTAPPTAAPDVTAAA